MHSKKILFHLTKYLFTLHILARILYLEAFGQNFQNIATIDYTAVFILHPLMSNYNFQKGKFEKSPLFANKENYDNWLSQVLVQISSNREKYNKDLERIKSEIQKLQKEKQQLTDRYYSTINSLTSKYDQLRMSNRPEDKALLSKLDYYNETKRYEQKYKTDLKQIEDKIHEAQMKYSYIEDLIESPQFTTASETKYYFNIIENDIASAASIVMKSKGLTILLNSSGMGVPGDITKITDLDPNLIAKHSNTELELYKALLSGNIKHVDGQIFFNEQYKANIEQSMTTNLINSIKRTLQARSGLRLLEFDISPRVLIGGIPITIDVINYILYQYKMPEYQRGIIIQVLREVNIK